MGRKIIGMDYERALRAGEAIALGEYDRPHGFHMETPEGRVVHVTGDPRMDDETAAALAKMFDLAYAQFAGEREG